MFEPSSSAGPSTASSSRATSSSAPSDRSSPATSALHSAVASPTTEQGSILFDPHGGPSSKAYSAETYGNLEDSSPIEQAPLIIVEGFCCATNSLVWGAHSSWLDRGEDHWRHNRGEALSLSTPPHSRTSTNDAASHLVSSRQRPRKPRRVILAPIGPLSSLHDRACELFYALKGGTIDYGAEHARLHGHARFGRTYAKGLWEDWSASKPAHFMGHSLGGPTILKLQSLLREGFFDPALGLSSRPDGPPETRDVLSLEADRLVRSVTSVSSPFRGTQLVYLLGSNPLPYPSVRFLSVGDILAKAVHLATYLDIGPDLLSDAWPFSPKRLKTSASPTADEKGHELARESTWDGFSGFLKQLRKSSWAESSDCAPWDCTFAAREEEEKEASWGAIRHHEGAKTWYRSYAAYMTMPAPAASVTTTSSKLEKGETAPLPYHIAKPSATIFSPFTLTSKLIGKYDFDLVSPRPSFWNPRPPQTPLAAALDVLRTPMLHADVKGKGRALDDPGPPEYPWHAMRRLSSQSNSSGMLTRQEPLLGGAVPALANLGSAAWYTPVQGSDAGTSYFDAKAASKPQEPLEQWYANDGVVPLASQFHPGICEEGNCVHTAGLPGKTPKELAVWEKEMKRREKRRLQLFDAGGARASIDSQGRSEREGASKPRPWEAEIKVKDDGTAISEKPWSIVPALKRASKAAASKLVGQKHVVPDQQEDPHFQPWGDDPPPYSDLEAQHCSPSSSGTSELLSSPEMTRHTLSHPQSIPPELELPRENVWHVHTLRDTSHTALCPLWIGTEQQRTFWSGMGAWLASVDEAAAQF